MFYRLSTYLNYTYYDLKTQRIRLLTPLPSPTYKKMSYVLVSQVCKKDFNMFLVSYHSFVRHCGYAEQTYIIDDGTLTAEHHLILTKQISNLKITNCSNIIKSPFPSKLCWERLLLISELIKQHYVIQLDADTISLGKLDQVISCIESNQSFTQGTALDIGQQISDCQDIVRIMSKSRTQHVQVLAEQNLPTEGCKYVRGCAGFAGYGIKSFSLEQLIVFFNHMNASVGTLWNTWGCDQVASNFLVACSNNAKVLDTNKYVIYNSTANLEQAIFVHYIGTCRFKKGNYLQNSKEFVATL